MEFKKLLTIGTTVSVDLSSTLPMTLCQDIILKPQVKYQIKYSLYVIIKLMKMTLTVHLNNVNISSIYIDTPSTFGNQTDYFYAVDVNNQLCFN